MNGSKIISAETMERAIRKMGIVPFFSNRIPGYSIQRQLDAVVDGNAFILEPCRHGRAAAADTDQRRRWPVCGHLLKGITYDRRCIVADAQLKEDDCLPVSLALSVFLFNDFLFA